MRCFLARNTPDDFDLRDLDGHAVTDPPKRRDRLLISRCDCMFFCIEVPHLGLAAERDTVERLLGDRFPGELSNTSFDWFVQRTARHARLLVVLMDKSTLAAYLKAAGKAQLIVLADAVRRARRGEGGRALRRLLVSMGDYGELITLKGGAVVSSTLVDSDELARGAPFAGAICRETSDGTREASQVELISSEELPRLFDRRLHPRPLFRHLQTRFAWPSSPVLLVAMIVALAAAHVGVYRDVRANRLSLASFERRPASSAGMPRIEQSGQSPNEQAALELSHLLNRVPLSPYTLLSELAAAVGDRALLRTMSVNGREVRLAFEARDPLTLLSAVSSVSLLEEVTLVETVSPEGSNTTVLLRGRLS